MHGRLDLDYAKNPDDGQRISGGRVLMNGVAIGFSSVTQKFVTLSLIVDKLAAGVMVTQDMIYVHCLLELIWLGNESIKMFKMDNSVAADIATSWSVRGHSHHNDACNYFLYKLKDQGLLVIEHVLGDSNDADIFTKNVISAVINQPTPQYVGHDEYIIVPDHQVGGAVQGQNSLDL